MKADGSWEDTEETDGFYCGFCGKHLSDDFDGHSSADSTIMCSTACAEEYDDET